MAKVISQLLVMIINCVIVNGYKRTVKSLYRPFGPQRCVELCKYSGPPVLFMREYRCRRITASIRNNKENQTDEELFTCISKGKDDEKARCLLATVSTRKRPNDGTHGSTCKTKQDCKFPKAICNKGLCYCTVGNYFDPKTKACVLKCDAYDDEMTYFDHYSILEHNDVGIYNVSLSECLQHCTCETGFVCLTAEYRATLRECQLSKMGYKDVYFVNRSCFTPGLCLLHRTRCK